MKYNKLVTVGITVATLISMLPGCGPASNSGKIDSYIAVAPLVLQSGTREAMSVTLLSGEKPVAGDVQLTLLQNSTEVVKVNGRIDGKGIISFDVPANADGDFTLRISGDGFQNEGPVKVARSSVILLETDKPIYKPGQTIMARIVTVNADLIPVTRSVTIEALDAKGIKIFRQTVNTDDYGMAKIELPLSDEPNLGTWKLVATSGNDKTQLDVRVEEYVLPKYEVTVNLAKEWFLVSERIKGNIKAEYSFGKPVNGDLIIKASKYAGTWQQYATINAKVTNGTADFDIPAAGYVAGVPGAGGQGNVRLEITVTEKATGYVENTERLLTIAQSGTVIQIIPPSSNFKPGLPFDFMIVTESPDNQMKDLSVQVSVTSVDKDFKNTEVFNKKVSTVKGKAIVPLTPPANAAALTINCSTNDANTYKAVTAAYSPTSNFIHVEQLSDGVPDVGAEIKFHVYATKESPNLYYEVVSRGRVVFSDFTSGTDISFKTTPLMAPSSRLLVYQILPNSEVAADYIPFKVTGDYPQDIQVTFGKDEVKPGDKIDINIQTQGEAKVGLAAVDRSVFILAENRLNLEQVFAELERLYMQPQAELHEVTLYPSIAVKGASDVFKDAQVMVLSGNKIPAGQEYKAPGVRDGVGGIFFGGAEKAANGVVPPMVVPAPSQSATTGGEGLAVVERVRQYFPETWVWQDVVTNLQGKATVQVTAPDSITTWALRAIALSKKNGLGITEDQLRVFQPFFLSCDLPYSAVRSEEFPVKVAVYNYLNTTQQVTVKIEPSPWFDLLDKSEKVINTEENDIGGAEFVIRPKLLGLNQIKVTAQSKEMADAVLKDIIIDAEGVARELVDNLTLSPGADKTIDTTLPELIIDGSGRVFVSVTAGFLTQTIDGLDKLIQMPFGCGEQNMIVFAPDVYITKYLKASGQLKPEIMAKAEKLMITGYQRELTYRHSDGSFSAFGESDKEGSLWLTAFVLKCFAQAKGLIYIDDSILTSAASWIKSHQNADGSFDQFGLVIHQELLGGVKGKTALTAFIANALLEAGEKDAAAKAVTYLEGQLDTIDDPYALALTTYVLELGGSNKRNAAYDKLMKLAIEDENGLHWGKEEIIPLPEQPIPQGGIAGGMIPAFRMPPQHNASTQIENTAYAMLALTKHGDNFNAARAAKWLTSKRNAYGGYGSTQDTVVALQALTDFATNQKSDVDLTVTLAWGSEKQTIRLTPDNFDVLQIVQVPAGEQVKITTQGKGEAVGQVVRRYNVADADKPAQEILAVTVDYDSTQVAVNDIVKVSASVTFNPPVQLNAEPLNATGMVVLDVSVPTGFTPVIETVQAAIKNDVRLKRYEVAGRKVIFYIEDMKPGDKVSLTFDVKAMYPVKAKGVASTAYSYYTPDIKGETLSKDVTVTAQ